MLLAVLSGVCVTLRISMISWVSDWQFLNHQQVNWTCKSVHFGLKAQLLHFVFLISRVRYLKWIFLWLNSLCGLSSCLCALVSLEQQPVAALLSRNANVIGWVAYSVLSWTTATITFTSITTTTTTTTFTCTTTGYHYLMATTTTSTTTSTNDNNDDDLHCLKCMCMIMHTVLI